MNTYQVGDKVTINTANLSADRAAVHNRLYPGGCNGVVVEVDEMTLRYPYKVEFGDHYGWYSDGDLLPYAVPAEQASLFEGAA